MSKGQGIFRRRMHISPDGVSSPLARRTPDPTAPEPMIERLLLMAGLACATAAAAQQYPAKPVRLIVPTAPGGGADLVARVLAQKLSKPFGQSFVVDNKGGAGTTLGTDIAAKSPADGYTLILHHISLAFNVSFYKNLPYDVLRDFAPISLVANQPYVIVVHPSLPVRSIKELVSLAQARPGSITYASGGSGSGPYMATELLKNVAHIDLLHVPYKGAGPALSDLIGGQTQLMIATISLGMPHTYNGKLRALAVTSGKRIRSAPAMPTVKESGIADYEFSTWYGLLAPAGTPKPVIAKLNEETVRILKDPPTSEKLSANGIDPIGSSPEEFASYLGREIEKWALVVKAAKLLAD